MKKVSTVVILKSSEEIERIRTSSQIVAKTLTLLKKESQPGVTTLHLNKRAEEFALDHGARPSFKGYLGYPYSLCVSINEEVIHGLPSKCCLKEGDIVSLDFGAEINGYHGDSAITFCVGESSEEINKFIKIGQECLYRGISKAGPQNRIGDISYAIQSLAEENSYNVIKKFVGHGIGRNLHEPPQIANFLLHKEDRGLLLKAGMVIAIEPILTFGSDEIIPSPNSWTIITKDKKPAVHWEHTVAITENGPVILSIREDELREQK